MLTSHRYIEAMQTAWSQGRSTDRERLNYAATLGDNLFLGQLRPETDRDFREGDGAELDESLRRPAKMRAHVSSSALAVNFFDAWRGSDMTAISSALGLGSVARQICFEYKPKQYPVGPRSPNFDLLLTLQGGYRAAVEAKFAEPFRPPGPDAIFSPKYFPDGEGLWQRVGLSRSQQVVRQLAPRWHYLDVAQLLKHMLGLASEGTESATLVYLWFDTGLPDAEAHKTEVARFAEEVRGDRVAFVARTYQEVFAALRAAPDSPHGWHAYMGNRYFGPRDAVYEALQPTGAVGTGA